MGSNLVVVLLVVNRKRMMKTYGLILGKEFGVQCRRNSTARRNRLELLG